MKHLFTFMSVLLLLSSCANRTQEDPASTVFNEDGTITFNYRNDSAEHVQLTAQFLKHRQEMLRDSVTGLWTVTLGPVAPDIYPYNYIVDGMPIMDDQCDDWFPNEGFKSSLLQISNPDHASAQDLQEVPHGSVEYLTYYSKTLEGYNRALVYLPPSYDGKKEYPVLYLISGTSDTEETFFKVGRINMIADNLIAKKIAKEMIIVLPYRNPLRNDDTPRDINIENDPCSQDLEQDLMPYIEENYRTINDAEHRAIGGFSRGGNQALTYGLTHLDKFSYLLSYSAYTSYNLPKVFDNAKATNDKINLFWIGMGKEDYLFKIVHEYLEFLSVKDIRYVMQFSEGKNGHTWMNVRYFVAHTLPLVFNKEDSKELMERGMMVMPELKGNERRFSDRTLKTIFPDRVCSPEYGEPGSVTLRIKAANAKHVYVEGEMLKEPAEMQREENGVWSLTLKGIKPDVYCYNFVVDGTRMIDCSNTLLTPEIGFKRSVMELPGSPYALQAGIDTTHTTAPLKYSAACVKYMVDGTAFVKVVPTGHETENLPVVSLLSGKKHKLQAWQQVANAQQILDQMIAAEECKPCILNMTEGEQPLVNSTFTLNADNFQTWAERRQALINTLKSIQ